MIATPGQRNRLMQKLRAETCFRRKNGIQNERSRRTESMKKENVFWELRPQTPGIYRVHANPSH